MNTPPKSSRQSAEAFFSGQEGRSNFGNPAQRHPACLGMSERQLQATAAKAFPSVAVETAETEIREDGRLQKPAILSEAGDSETQKLHKDTMKSRASRPRSKVAQPALQMQVVDNLAVKTVLQVEAQAWALRTKKMEEEHALSQARKTREFIRELIRSAIILVFIAAGVYLEGCGRVSLPH